MLRLLCVLFVLSLMSLVSIRVSGIVSIMLTVPVSVSDTMCWDGMGSGGGYIKGTLFLAFIVLFFFFSHSPFFYILCHHHHHLLLLCLSFFLIHTPTHSLHLCLSLSHPHSHSSLHPFSNKARLSPKKKA